ncbi:hypothetical protein ISN45_Aa06g025920 [Arabidopsis thaliana x Arabidopsis arenosa]|uniref:Uncharacterized protein n=1 Tax=Arabidopsis thaliana x Arabidopsis arenosa TaxID=1240361 RepID=A0A8T1Z245_9BRAS|nr:hypothetical protein ISN45_Aa06g025920 [Arabidopsis thaliana x Arabidopsis arenosa]
MAPNYPTALHLSPLELHNPSHLRQFQTQIIFSVLSYLNRSRFHQSLYDSIPGPLVRFFQSLTFFNGLISDITLILPNFSDLWNASKFHPNFDNARQILIPAIILDQLYHFAAFWNSVFSAGGFTRVNAAATPFTSIDNLHGFKNQFGDSQINWFIELVQIKNQLINAAATPFSSFSLG